MEEVDGSNPSRSTKPFKHLPSLTSQKRSHRSPAGVRNPLMPRQPLGMCGLPIPAHNQALRFKEMARLGTWAAFFTRVVVCWRRQHFVSYTGECPSRPKPETLSNLVSRFTLLAAHVPV